MEISIYNQLLTVLFSVVLGAFCGIIYDLVKIFRKILVKEYNKKLINKQSKKQYKGISNPIFKRKSKKYKIKEPIEKSVLSLYLFDTGAIRAGHRQIPGLFSLIPQTSLTESRHQHR